MSSILKLQYLFAIPYIFQDVILLIWGCCPVSNRISFSLNSAFRFEIVVEFEVLKSIKILPIITEVNQCHGFMIFAYQYFTL